MWTLRLSEEKSGAKDMHKEILQGFRDEKARIKQSMKDLKRKMKSYHTED